MGIKTSMYLALAVLLSAAVLIPTALHIKNLLEVNLEGVVEVEPKTIVVNVGLEVRSSEGEITFDLGNVYIPAGSVIVRKVLSSYEGNFTLILNGELFLMSDASSYRISMPCLLDIWGRCCRIMMLIPGYDTPLKVEGGNYAAKLTLRWSAGGTGNFNLKLYLEFNEASEEASINVIGIKPENVDGWEVAENSTKSYSMLVSPASPTRTIAWVWIFDPNNLSTNALKLTLVDASTGKTLIEKTVSMLRDGVYWSVLVEVRTPAEGKYKLVSAFGNIVMSKELN